MKVSVLLPSYMRPELLRNCLGALERQTRLPDEVVVVLRDTDVASREAFAAIAGTSRLALRLALVARPGQLPALNTGLSAVTGEIVCITDDDAEPLPDWVERIERWFQSDETLGGVGGRDHIHRAGVPVPSRPAKTIGRIQWFGRIIGNHSQDSIGPRVVDVLKGCNMSYRTSLSPRFDERLLGDAYQNEATVCLAITARGMKLLYDPAIRVNHYLGERHFGSERDGLTPQRLFNNSFNGVVVRLPHFSRLRGWVFLVYTILVGDVASPGLVRSILLGRGHPKTTLQILRPSIAGKLAALKTLRTPAPAA